MNREELQKILPILKIFSWGSNTEAFFVESLERMINESKGMAKKLNEVFGVDGKFEQYVSIPRDDYAKLYEYITCVLPDKERLELLADINKFEEYLKKNALPSGKKLSKHLITDGFLTKQGLCRLDTYVKHNNMPWDIIKNLPNIPSDINPLLNFDDIVSATIEDFKTNNETCLGFGWDYATMANCMSSLSFTSCMNIQQKGEQALWIPFAMCASERAACIYIRKGTSVLGRCVILFSEDYKSFVVKPLYGSISRQQVDIVLEYIMNKISTEHKWYIRTGDTMKNILFTYHCDALYNDRSIMEASCNVQDNIYVLPPNDTFPDTFKCHKCKKNDGSYHYYGYCMDCYNNTVQSRCIHCGNNCTPNSNVCPACSRRKDSLYLCSECGKHKTHGTSSLCIKCMLGKECNFCRATGELHEISTNVHACKSCVTELATHSVCRFCGDEDVIIRNGYVMCNKCYVNMLALSYEVRESSGDMNEFFGKSVRRGHEDRQSTMSKTIRSARFLKFIPEEMRTKYFTFLKNKPWVLWDYCYAVHYNNAGAGRDAMYEALRTVKQ